ncbi:MAG TPA: flagellar basal-body MS-ring/collar protein FliF [Patescibacteria group bacterium]|nr:flagellar basal-body MS-ring/collar protein FliF [Patescibacteria group bacterium]
MKDWKERSLRLWQKIDKRQRYIIFGATALLFVAILAWSFWWGSRPDNVPLFTGLEAKDAGEIAAKLKETKVPYEISNNGTAIMVSAKDVHRIRLELANQGLPRGSKGFEIFDQTKFGVTEFQNKVYLLQAIQGELTRTIEQMAEVEKARVHIVLPEDSLYKKNEKAATASIMLKLRMSPQTMKPVELSPEQVKGIINLVAHSIQGLKPENVTVLDNFAHVLNEDAPDDQLKAGKVTLTQLELTKKVQEGMQKDVQTLLEQVLGPGKAAARVNVELNFDQRTTDRQVFEPVVDDKGIIRSSQDMNESYKGSTPGPGGVPGTTTNIPGYVTTNNTQSSYEKKEVTRNYEINETKEKVVASPGSIRRLTVAVIVDANMPKAQQDSIAKTVASAIGLNTNRGDSIAVEGIAFNNEAADKQRQEEDNILKQQQQALWLKIALFGLIVAAALIIARIIVRRRQQEEDIEVIGNEDLGEEEEQPPERLLTKEEKTRMDQRTSIETLAKTKPDDVAQLLKAWIGDE